MAPPKLLDFGIAKILDPESVTGQFEPTVTVFRVLTPGYASPEQLKGEPITTASDVYSLGVVLYELLTGQHPYRKPNSTPQEVARAVCEVEPEKPSRAVQREETAKSHGGEWPSSALPEIPRGSAEKRSKRLRGDLDNIVLMALRKEPQRRYSSADQLAADIRRHLASLPVVARKDSSGYRASKFVSRHKVGVAVALLTSLALLAALAVTLREARIATAQRVVAERRLQQAQKLTESLIVALPTAIDNGPTSAREFMNQKALEYLSEVALETSPDPRLKFDLALGYVSLAEGLAHPAYAHTGDQSSALEKYQRAITLLEQQLTVDPSNGQVPLFLARAYSDTGMALLGTDVSKAVGMYSKALASLAAVSCKADSDTGRPRNAYELLIVQNCERLRWSAYELLGEQYGSPYFANLGDTSRAEENLRKAIDIAERLNRSSPSYQYPSYYSYIGMAGVLWARGDGKGALNYQNQAEAVFSSMTLPPTQVGDDPLRIQAPYSQSMRDERAMAMIRRANLLAETGRLKEAQAVLRESREILERLFWSDALNGAVRRDLTRNYNLDGDLLLRTGDLPGALEIYRRALAINSEFLAAQPNQPEVRHRLADSHEGIGNTLAAMGRTREALQSCTDALAIRESLAKLDPNDARYSRSLAENYVSAGNILSKAHNRAPAMDNYRRALAIQQVLVEKDRSNTLVARDLAATQRIHALHLQ